MATQNKTKLKTLVKNIKPGTVALASWLEYLGISRDLQKHYLRSGWLEAIGRGAYKKPEDELNWEGGVYTLQNQTNLRIHVGALSALSLQGFSHYIRLNRQILYLFSPYKEKLPKWFKDFNWGIPVYHQQSSFLPEKAATIIHEIKNISVRISSAERAIMECLYLAPKEFDLVECYHLMEGLVNLRPQLVQGLLKQCKSVKVKRLFLYLGDKANHQWMKFLDTSVIDLGSGNRRITEGGVYVSEYNITIPKELAEL